MAKNRANKKTQAERLDRVIKLMGEGKMRYQVFSILSDEWGLGEWGLQKYWNAANKLIAEGFTDQDLVAMYREIHEQTRIEQPSIALKSIDSIAKLKLGGYKSSDIVININREESNGDNN